MPSKASVPTAAIKSFSLILIIHLEMIGSKKLSSRLLPLPHQNGDQRITLWGSVEKNRLPAAEHVVWQKIMTIMVFKGIAEKSQLNFFIMLARAGCFYFIMWGRVILQTLSYSSRQHEDRTSSSATGSRLQLRLGRFDLFWWLPY